MNLLILEPPYSNLFRDLATELNPDKVYVHLFNIGYSVYLSGLNKILIKKQLEKVIASEDVINKVKGVSCLLVSNKRKPSASETEIMAKYYLYLKSFIRDYKISTILCHNDLRWQHALAKQVAYEEGIKIFFSEEGLFRPHTMTFDSRGVNANSSLPQDEEFYRVGSFEEKKNFRLLPNSYPKRLERILRFVAFLLVNKLGDMTNLNVTAKNKNYSFVQYLKLFFAKLKHRAKTTTEQQLKKKYVFIALQVSNDTQTVIHSSFQDTQEFITLVEESYKKLPGNLREEYDLVFKQHPMESHINYAFSNFSIISTESTQTLLKNASLVVLINSTVIIEAMMLKKSIITLGNSQFNIQGLVKKVSPFNLHLAIEQALTSSESHPPILSSFLNYLKFHYQVNGNIFYYDKQTLSELANRIHNA